MSTAEWGEALFWAAVWIAGLGTLDLLAILTLLVWQCRHGV